MRLDKVLGQPRATKILEGLLACSRIPPPSIAYAKLGVGRDDEKRRAAARDSSENPLDDADRVRGGVVFETQEDDAVMRLAAFKGKLSEILVFGYKDAPLALGFGEDGSVVGPGEIIADPDHVMPPAAQRLRGGTTEVLVEQKLQCVERGAEMGNTASCSKTFSA